MPPDFIEIGTGDHAVARAFHTSLFGWKWVAMGDGPAGYFSDGDRQVGLHDGDDPCVVPYFRVADIDAMADRVRGLGGTVMGAVTDAPGLGRFATCTDLCGARFGLHQET